MSLSLTTSDWITINQLIYKMNTVDSIAAYPDKVLEYLNLLCPYSYGIFNIVREEEGHQEIYASAGVNISAEDIRILTEKDLRTNTFMTGLCLEPGGHVSRGPIRDYMNPEVLSEIEESVIPEDSEKALCLILGYNNALLGYIIITRDSDMDPFCRRDLCALDSVRNHIALQLYKLMEADLHSHNEEDGRWTLEKRLEQYALSKREVEVLYLLTKGYSDQQVCDKLFITPSTFKKHLNHIYTKLRVSSRVELLRLTEKEPSR